MTGMGYDPAELPSLPADAVANAFGCDSPVALTHLAPGDVLLDLGCGAGIDLLLAAAKVGPTGRVIGIDLADAMVERARANVAAAGLANAEVRKGAMEDVPVADTSVDWVISNCAINLSPDKGRVFSEVARVLRPGGGLRVADVVAEASPEWLEHSHVLCCSAIAGIISEADYVAGLRNAGLTDVTVGGRYVYDRDQLAEIVAHPQASPADVDRVAGVLVGRVWSACFSAAKPPRS